MASRKRQRTAAPDDEELELQDGAAAPLEDEAEEDEALEQGLPTDLQATLQLRLNQFPRDKLQCPPLTLRSMLYAYVDDKSAADRELEERRLSGELRLFKLPGIVDAYAVMPTQTYLEAITRAAEEQRDPAKAAVLQRFGAAVVPACRDVSITEQCLVPLLVGVEEGEGDALGALLHAGLLLRHGHEAGLFLFGVPHVGPLVRSVQSGRQELLGALRRRRHPELPEAELLKRPLRRSVLPPAFHLAEMLGSGALVRMHTTRIEEKALTLFSHEGRTENSARQAGYVPGKAVEFFLRAAAKHKFSVHNSGPVIRVAQRH